MVVYKNEWGEDQISPTIGRSFFAKTKMGKRDLPVIIMLLLPRILCSNHKKKLRRGGGGTGVTGNQGKERAEFKKSRGGEIRHILKDVLSNIQSEIKLGLYKSKNHF